MSLPSSITSADQYDAGSKDPKQARAQLKGLHDDVVQINDHLKASPLLSPATPLGIGDGLESASGNLRVQLQADPGIARAASGLALDIDGLTALSAPAVGDLLAIRDASAGARRKITLEDLLKVIDALAEETAPDDADKLLLYDASGAVVKKVRADKIGGGGGWEFAADFTANNTATTLDLSSAFSDDHRAYELLIDQLQPFSASGLISLEVKTASGWETGNDYTTGRVAFSGSNNVSNSRNHLATSIDLSGGVAVSSTTTSGMSGRVLILDTRDTGRESVIQSRVNFNGSGGVFYNVDLIGSFNAARAITGARLVSGSNNLEGKVRVRRQKYPDS